MSSGGDTFLHCGSFGIHYLNAAPVSGARHTRSNGAELRILPVKYYPKVRT
jgi:hypothetical protein